MKKTDKKSFNEPEVYRVEYDEMNQYIFTTVKGPVSLELILQIYREIGKCARENRCSRILSDLRHAEITASMDDMNEMAKRLTDMNMHVHFKRSIVVPKDTEIYHFWEKICHNQGHSLVRVFSSCDEAKNWLLQDN